MRHRIKSILFNLLSAFTAQDALGLDHFEGRTYRGWNHHVTLVSIAHAFLTLERRRRPPPRAAA